MEFSDQASFQIWQPFILICTIHKCFLRLLAGLVAAYIHAQVLAMGFLGTVLQPLDDILVKAPFVPGFRMSSKHLCVQPFCPDFSPQRLPRVLPTRRSSSSLCIFPHSLSGDLTLGSDHQPCCIIPLLPLGGPLCSLLRSLTIFLTSP